MARLPSPGADNGTWGAILNEYLAQVHEIDGTLKAAVVTSTALAPNSVDSAALAPDAITATELADDSVGLSALNTTNTPSANQILAYDGTDLVWMTGGGVSSVDSVNGQTGTVVLTKSDIDLGNVDNTSDANKPISTAVSTALGAKLTAASNLSDLGNASTARTNLGLGGAAVLNVGTAASTVAAGDDSRIVGAVQASTATAKGDLLAASAAGTVTRLGVGTDGQMLVADSSTATGLAWSTASTTDASKLAIANNLSDLANAATARTNLGIGNVDNTSDANKPISTATATALADKVDESIVTTKGDLLAASAANTIIRLGVGTDGQMLVADSGETSGLAWATPSSTDTTKLAIANNLSDLADAPTARTNLGLGNVDNTSDANKPVSTATATALGGKLNVADNLSDVADAPTARANLGLGNVDNTSDANKPVSTATQTALDAKADEAITVTGATSLTGGGDLSANRTISLVNDNASPGNSFYYGTDGAGAKGYHALPSGVTATSTTTLTNKRITKRIQTLTDAATVTPDIDAYDGGKLLTVSQATDIANPTGTPTDFQQYILRIKSASAQTLTFGAQFRGGTDAVLPVNTTGGGTWDYLGFQWHSEDSRWDLIAFARGY